MKKHLIRILLHDLKDNLGNRNLLCLQPYDQQSLHRRHHHPLPILKPQLLQPIPTKFYLRRYISAPAGISNSRLDFQTPHIRPANAELPSLLNILHNNKYLNA